MSAADSSNEIQQSKDNNFVQLYSGKVEDFIPLVKYKSKRTGLTLCIADVGGPTVNGYLCLATEAHDDDGLPHTLEHLIFLGSEDYPYKGVLDLCANRCFASGTNAWTAQDHTCYTVTTAGSEGFLNFLPIYLDHLIYPVLNDQGYTTEVHHVNEAGEDAGVVYCEMQGVENTGESLVNNSMLRAMYPGKCGYKSNTGGALKNLRESTNNEKVKKYHQDFYRSENLCIIITGQVLPEEVFKAIKPLEDKIVSKAPRGDFIRPWQLPVPPLENDVLETVAYPCDDDTIGMALLAWRGPAASDAFSLVVLDVLLLYLTDTSVAPLQRDFVEIEDPFCSNISYNVELHSEGHLELFFENVPKLKLGQIKPKLEQIFKKIISKGEEINMERMASVIHRKILTILSILESKPYKIVIQHMISDFLYGNENVQIEKRLSQVAILKELKDFDADFWSFKLKEYFVDHKSVVILGEPSCDLMTKIAETENERVAKQRECLGEKGLLAKAEELQNASAFNDIAPPSDMISSMTIPDVAKVKFHNILRSTNHSDLAPDVNSSFPLESIPLRFQLDDLQSNFVSLHAILDTSNVPQKLKLFLPLLLELSLESPIIRNGAVIPHEIVVKELASDTVASIFTLGITCHESRFTCAESAQVAHLHLQVEIEKYAKGVQWLWELLHCVQFTEERIKIVATKIINDVSTKKRDGYFVAKCLVTDLCFSKESNRKVNNLMRQYSFLTSLLTKLASAPKEVIADLESTRNMLTSFNNITIHVATCVSKLVELNGDPAAPWNKFFKTPEGGAKVKGKLTVQKCSELLLPFGRGLPSNSVVGVGSVESSFIVQYSPCSISHTHPDVPAILVLLQYLTQLEGPMWKGLRGAGLAYGYGADLDLGKGIIYMYLYRSSHPTAAYKEFIKIMEMHINGTERWDEALIESARSSLMFELINQEETVKSILLQSLIMHLKELEANYYKNLLLNVSKITVDDLNRVGALYGPQFFDKSRSWLAICCNPSKVDEIASEFKEFSRDIEVTQLECGFMSQCE